MDALELGCGKFEALVRPLQGRWDVVSFPRVPLRSTLGYYICPLWGPVDFEFQISDFGSRCRKSVSLATIFTFAHDDA